MRKTIAFLVVLLVVVTALVAYDLFPKDSVSKTSVNQTVLKFREQMSKAAHYPRHSGALIPPYGVYTYSTRGSELIESTAFSTGHHYGALTGIAITPTRCGVMERWQPLVQSWTEGELCLGPKTSRVVAVRTFHEFFGESKLVRYHCLGGSAPYSAELQPGIHWVTRCRSDQGTVLSNVSVVGLGTVRVKGKPIEAVHLHSAVKLSGDPDGTDSQDSWLRRSDGLLLRRTEQSKAHVDAAGGGEYADHYEITLISTKPQH